MIEAVTYFGLVIHKTDSFDYVDSSQIPEEYKPEFYSWMTGQTSPLIEDCPGAVFRHDFERWFKMRFHGQPTYFD